MNENYQEEKSTQYVICPQCHNQVDAESLNCPICGFPIRINPNETRLLTHTEAPEVKRAPVGNIPLYFQRIRFTIDGRNIELPASAHLIVGRYDSTSDEAPPDVDLTPFDAIEKGVSRHHLALTWKNDLIYVSDLDSRNGTMLNGQRLMSGIARLLRNGDELMIGQLLVQVHFTDTGTLAPR